MDGQVLFFGNALHMHEARRVGTCDVLCAGGNVTAHLVDAHLPADSLLLDGKHTTTFAEMFPLNFGGYVVDTPGIRSFGTSGLSNEDVAHNFPEFFSRLSECRFYNCTHTNEPGCAVKAAVESGEIEPSRYESYISICFGGDGKYREGRRG